MPSKKSAAAAAAKPAAPKPAAPKPSATKPIKLLAAGAAAYTLVSYTRSLLLPVIRDSNLLEHSLNLFKILV